MLDFSVKKVPKIANQVPPRRDLKIWQKDIKKEVETLENNGFTLVMADEAIKTHTFLVRVRSTCAALPNRPTPSGNQRQTVCGGVILDGQAYLMAAKKANDRSFGRYLDNIWRRFGKSAVIVDSAAYHNSRRVRRCLKSDGGFAKLLFLLPYSPFPNSACGCGASARRGSAGRSDGRPKVTSGGRWCSCLSHLE